MRLMKTIKLLSLFVCLLAGISLACSVPGRQENSTPVPAEDSSDTDSSAEVESEPEIEPEIVSPLAEVEIGGPFSLSDTAVITSTGLVYEDLIAGEGPVARTGDTLSVVYTGYLQDDSVFDSNVDSGRPFEFPLGAGYVIPGWDEGLVGMRVGGSRLLVIPPELAYGSTGSGGVIPPNATLTFQVKLLEIK
jgi:FKBP-type peptidyl-prolyl cis-trans isomerase